jgi:hypothetical protein
MKNEMPHRNRSPHGWWIASYGERAAWDDDPDPSPASRCLAWENTMIFQATDREAAYVKALSLSQNASTLGGGKTVLVLAIASAQLAAASTIASVAYCGPS